MAAIRALIRASHPGPAVLVTTVAVLLGVGFGRTPADIVLIGLAVMAGQLSIGWHNDHLDLDRDLAAARLDKPLATGEIPAGAVRWAVAVSAVACVVFSLLTGPAGGVLHIAAVASAWSYNQFYKHTPWSVLPFVFSFGLLPAFVAGGPTAAPWWTVLAGGLLGGGAHFANVLPDLADDAATGVRGLPHRFGRLGSELTAAGLLLAAAIILAVAIGRWYALTGLAVAVIAIPVGLWLGRNHGGRMVFRTVMALALVDVVLLVAGSASVTA
ncbi:UbiA family prenyltransferase [Phytomonospora sp. NPDC050363]|uniref:UbiA family prenyltransferase n=1 Tax=Phytomonospora sp. NPDC050363 TaxID=3155642 RepID=UPI00340E1009